MNITELAEIGRAIVADGKGILAADESIGTITERFDSIGVASTETSRRDYRTLLFTTPGAGSYISGAILYDETIRQKAADGTRLVDVLNGARRITMSLEFKNVINEPQLSRWELKTGEL